MYCCCDCFSDEYIVDMITSYKKEGMCDFCGSKEAYIYDLDNDNYLEDDFISLMEVYSIAPDEDGRLLIDELIETWDLFENLSRQQVEQLVKLIVKERVREAPSLFKSNVYIPELKEESFLSEQSLFKWDWKDFSTDVKNHHRFHTTLINTNILNDFCKESLTLLKKGDKFYRARLSPSSTPLNKDEMKTPPKGEATSGRANPDGISHLYLSDAEKTTIYEVRAGLHDFVSVATFELLEDLELVDFTKLDFSSPFHIEEETIKKFALNKPHLQRVSAEIARPIRRNDLRLDYFPTQYIVDFIKSCGYKGIKFRSAMYKKGMNYTIFNEDYFDIIGDINLFDVNSIRYCWESVNN